MNTYESSWSIGILQTLAGHPYDTLKVLNQCGVNTNKINFTGKNLFAGIFLPLVVGNSGTIDVFNSYCKNHSNFIAGMMSGACMTPFTYLIDCNKIRKQTKEFVSGPKVHLNTFTGGPGSFIRKGYLTTLMRESFGAGIFFTSFCYIKEKGYNSILSSMGASTAAWTMMYPIDTIKTRQMAFNISFVEAFNMKNLWKGYTYCMCRLVMVHWTAHFLYELHKDLSI